MNIKEAITFLQEIERDYGNLPFYLLYDDFVFVEIAKIGIAGPEESYHVRPKLYPLRVVAMGKLEINQFEDFCEK